jgi:hypothetical protein
VVLEFEEPITNIKAEGYRVERVFETSFVVVSMG